MKKSWNTNKITEEDNIISFIAMIKTEIKEYYKS
jgi:hypothetical protein